MLWDLVAGICFILGVILSLVAALGVLVFPDLLSRMHAAAKPQVLGLFLMLIGFFLEVRSWEVLGVVCLVWCFQILAVPVAAHMVGRVGYRCGKYDADNLIIDELDNLVSTIRKDDV